ncbi:hypothetical protein [Breoghania sp.]|uniref:TSCPD domain-containing protein n=1 Tax=Breoghania sp. TaxID=2065378 RepID=UPI0029CA5533|nr:hypothetical protein [Breoghania sp.]
MSRVKLPVRRASDTLKFSHGPRSYYATIGFYDAAQERPGEVFLSTGRTGTELQALMRESAIAASLALQHGCSPEVLARALSRDEQGEAETALGRLFRIMTGEGEQ